MRYNKLVASLILAGAVIAPVYADDHAAEPMTIPTEAEAREKGAQMQQMGKDKAAAGKAKGEQMQQTGKDKAAAGKEKGEQMQQMGKDKAAAAKAGAGKARDDVVSGEKSAEEAADDVAEEAKESGEEMAEEAKKVPPGMAKRDEHPSTGKGSEQGQESRAPEQKSWWRFWD